MNPWWLAVIIPVCAGFGAVAGALFAAEGMYNAEEDPPPWSVEDPSPAAQDDRGTEAEE